jgi:membrane protease subunit (stomatin/prohibitin family)
MSDSVTIARVRLGDQHVTSGNTKHYRGNQLLLKPDFLKIVQYTDDEGFYLLYCDKDGVELTDTFHTTLKEAYEQAKWEFNVLLSDWEKL